MAPRKTTVTSPAQLLAFLLDPGLGRDRNATLGAFAPELGEWLRTGPRFRAFVDAHRDKIRKKLRNASDSGAQLDVRAELHVARLLLGDRRIELAFEPGGSRGGPDFVVSYRQAEAVNLEVTRPRLQTDNGPGPRQILAKLRQLPTGVPNIVLFAVPTEPAKWDIGATVLALRARADAKEEAYFVRRGFASARDFYDRLLRLGAVVTWAESHAAASAWINRSARSPVPDRALRACVGALRMQ